MPLKAEKSVWYFYLGFIISLLFEGALVHFLGLWLSLLTVLIVGMAWGLLSLVFTDPDKKATDPFFKASLWFLRKAPAAGYLPMVLLIGAPGTAITYKKLQHPRAKELTVLAAVIFAVVTVPSFHYIWR